jgi:hypothetical protein
MPRLLTPLLAAALCLLAVTFAAPAPASAQSPKLAEQDISLLYTQTTSHGTMEPTACTCKGRRVLTLHGVSAQMVWFSDRPARKSGQLSTRLFAREWAGFGFRADPPNAALSLLGADRRSDTVVVELLSRPRYDRAKRTMRYVLRVLPEASGNLAGFEAGRDARVARRFRAASLFIDDASAPVVSGCVLAPGTSCAGAELVGEQLSNAQLAGADLAGADLRDAHMQEAGLSGADLTGANLSGAWMFQVDMSGADLTGADLSDAYLAAANLTRANLTNANLSGVMADWAHLAYSVFTGADLTYADFTDADFGSSKYNSLYGAGVRCNTTMPAGWVDTVHCK